MDGMKITYDIVKNDYTGEYIVFKTFNEFFNFRGVFHSPKRKDCVEYIKSIKKKGRKTNAKKHR